MPEGRSAFAVGPTANALQLFAIRLPMFRIKGRHFVFTGYAEKHCNKSGSWSLDHRGRGERTDYTKCHRVDAILTQA